METLLDATDSSRRRLQHGAIFGGILLLLFAKAAYGKDVKTAGAIAAILGLLAIAAGFRVKLNWQAPYKGHTIRFENDPVRGEKLFVDDELVATGKLGFRVRLEASLTKDPGKGDRIIAECYAGFLSFRCKITAVPFCAPAVPGGS